MELSEKLTTLRKSKGLSQLELAEAINVSRQAISRWEVGTATPSAENLKCLSEYYEISIDELLDIAVDGRKEKKEEKPAPESKAGVPQKLLILACTLIVIVAIVTWAIFYMFQRTEKEKVGLQELESKEYMSGDVIDMDIKSTNS